MKKLFLDDFCRGIHTDYIDSLRTHHLVVFVLAQLAQLILVEPVAPV